MNPLNLFKSNQQTETREVTKTIPYDEWPDECYVCDDELDGEVRGQFVVHRGEDPNNIKAVGLCRTCTFTYTTLIDHHEELVGIYDGREEPDEI